LIINHPPPSNRPIVYNTLKPPPLFQRWLYISGSPGDRVCRRPLPPLL
jgi:hypothetical protein